MGRSMLYQINQLLSSKGSLLIVRLLLQLLQLLLLSKLLYNTKQQPVGRNMLYLINHLLSSKGLKWNRSDYLPQEKYTQLLIMFSHHMLRFAKSLLLYISNEHKM